MRLEFDEKYAVGEPVRADAAVRGFDRADVGLGGAQIAGIFSTLFLAGGMAAGFIYGRLARILRINIVLLGG